jgi:hypothetical protein
MTIERCPEPVNFKELFRETGTREHPYPQQMTYKGETISLVDKFPVKNKETLLFSIESVNSLYPQGFSIQIFNGYLIINGEPMEYDKEANVLFWEDSTALDVKNIEVQVFSKKGHIFISNIWEETIYEEHKNGFFKDIDGSFTNSKIFRHPEGKQVTCYVDSGRWCAGLCNGAAMYSEDIPNGKRYFCNDGVEDDDFDDIIFTVTRQN